MNVPKQKHEQLQCGSYRKRKQHNEPIKTRIQHTWYWRKARETASDEVATGFVCVWLVEQVVAMARELFTTDSHKHSGNFRQNVIERATCFEINGTTWNVLQNRNYDQVDLFLVSFAKWAFFWVMINGLSEQNLPATQFCFVFAQTVDKLVSPSKWSTTEVSVSKLIVNWSRVDVNYKLSENSSKLLEFCFTTLNEQLKNTYSSWTMKDTH